MFSGIYRWNYGLQHVSLKSKIHLGVSTRPTRPSGSTGWSFDSNLINPPCGPSSLSEVCMWLPLYVEIQWKSQLISSAISIFPNRVIQKSWLRHNQGIPLHFILKIKCTTDLFWELPHLSLKAWVSQNKQMRPGVLVMWNVCSLRVLTLQQGSWHLSSQVARKRYWGNETTLGPIVGESHLVHQDDGEARVFPSLLDMVAHDNT